MLYHYVGPNALAHRTAGVVRGTPIHSQQDILVWVSTSPELRRSPEATVTFVVDAWGTLLIAERQTEHVACAGNRAVVAAGEMCFAIIGKEVEVLRISNQSTGYCPETSSWDAMLSVIESLGLTPPNGFDPCCEFRRCTTCDAVNIIKHEVFECAVCNSELPQEYNCQLHQKENQTNPKSGDST